MQIQGLNALSDNYIWILCEQQNIWVVDPGESQPLLDLIKKNNWQLQGILVTHHHGDHTDGIANLLAVFPNAEVYAGRQTQKPYITRHLSEGDDIQVLGQNFKVIETPGHTLDHIAYYNESVLFCGDTLFAGGCGRVFEGTAEQMTRSLLKLRALNDNIWVYCGHEYTLANMNFAAIAEPTNPAVLDRRQIVRQKTQSQQACVPSNLGEEKQTNPFLHFDQAPLSGNIAKRCGQETHNMTPTKLFAELRAWKDALDVTGELDE